VVFSHLGFTRVAFCDIPWGRAQHLSQLRSLRSTTQSSCVLRRSLLPPSHLGGGNLQEQQALKFANHQPPSAARCYISQAEAQDHSNHNANHNLNYAYVSGGLTSISLNVGVTPELPLPLDGLP
jgi:hypothetical protein